MADKQQRKASSTTPGPIRILHLSDFHLSAERGWDSDRVLAGLTDTIGKLVSADRAPDIVAITGDIADKGRKEEYEAARRWIDESLRPALPPWFPVDRILIVPGNHDVDRTKVNISAQAVQSALVSGGNQNAIAEVLSDAGQRGTLLNRHDAYLEFANGLRRAKDSLDVPWWSTTLALYGQRVHFAGFCSSWTSWSDTDYGNLLVGRWQVNKLLEKPKDTDWSVALIHHPWSFLAQFDADEVEATLHRECHVILRGHLHKQRSRAIQYPGDVCLELAAGSVYDGSSSSNAFQLVELDLRQRSVSVHFWLWRDGRWIPDRNASPETRDGVATFSLDVPTAPTDRATLTRSADPAKYLRSLQELTAYIDIRGLQVGSGKAHRFPIDELYIPLTTTARAEVAQAMRKEKDKSAELGAARELRVELDEALQHRHLVIVGDPGAGKTTFLNRIAHLLSRAQLGDNPDATYARLGLEDTAFPILIRVSELSEHVAKSRGRNEGPTIANSPDWLPHFLASSTRLDESFFRDHLESGSAIVLLDGLDEAPSEQQRKLLVDLVQKASGEGAYGKCRFVLTSRPGAYRGEAVLPDFAEVRIDALEDEAIETFLTRWCEALYPESPVQRQRHLSELLVTLRSRPEIRRMARNPVMLTALAVVHWNQKRLPEQRAELYESIIFWLASSRESKPGRPSPERCVTLHQELALAMQDHPDGRQTQVPRFWAAEQIAGEWRDAPQNERVRLAQAFLIEEELDSGIVVRRGDHIRYWHLTFQEYLAARALASRSEEDQRKQLFAQPKKLYQPEWREVVELAAGVLHHQGVRRVDAMFSAVLGQLSKRASLADQARCFGLLGAAVQDLSPVNYQPSDPRYQKMAQDVMGIFDAERSESVAIETAIEAAEALAQAGDPRFAHGNLEKNWVDIPAGSFLMGAQKKNPAKPNHDTEAYDSESPVHEVRLKAYRIGRYPVTVTEYKKFVDGGGYEHEEHWRAGGYGKWKQPHEWDEQLTHLNRPVTHVSWYEAAAYAASARCRSPTEAEWEWAARGTEGRRYPWGNEDPDPARTTFGGSNIGHATPVGVYPLGGTPQGILDMAGNIWEWCQDTWHDNYTSAPSDGSAWTTRKKSHGRVLRGGSWDHDEFNLRSAYRNEYTPDNRNVVIGFRLAAGT